MIALAFALACVADPGHVVVHDVATPHDLDGAWLFTTGDDPQYADPAFDDHAWRAIDVPVAFGAQGLSDVVGPFWYRAHIHVADARTTTTTATQLAITIGEIDSAYELYANGALIGARGRVDEPRADDPVHPAVWSLPNDALAAHDGDVVLAVRGFRSALRQSMNPNRGGLNRGPVRIGPTDVLAHDLVADDLLNFVLIGGFIVAGLYHLVMFRRRRAMREYFWFGLFALFVSAYVAAQTYVVSDALGALHDKATFFAVFLAVPTFLLFLRVFLRAPLTTPWRLWLVAHAVWTVATMAWPTTWLLHRFLLWWELVILVPLMLGSIALIARQARRGDPEARTVALGVVLLVATAANNVIRTLGVVTPELTNVAFAGFVIAMAASLSNRFTRAYNEIDALLAKTLHLSKLKEEFLANTSHELRTPLNAIINLPRAVLSEIEPRSVAVCSACGSTFAHDDDDDDDVSDVACPSCGESKLSIETRRASPDDADALANKMQSVIASGEQMLAVVNDIFDASKIASGTLELAKQRVSVDECVRAAIASVQAKADARRVVIVARIDGECFVDADRSRLVQIVQNLVDNAVKFSPENARVDVETVRSEREVEVRVVDRGPGIPSDQHTVIFEAFRQIDAGHTRKHGGTGLGLAIVKDLVALHGGTIRVDSAIGRGSTFVVRLPCA